MARMSRGIILTVAVGSLCGATWQAIGSAWGQPRIVRPAPVPDDEFIPPPPGRRVFVGNPPDEVNGVPVPMEADRFTIETNELIEAYRQSIDDKNRAALRSKLTNVLAKKFDAQHQRREQEITELKARLKRLTELHTKRTADRKGIIDRHSDFLLREVDGLGWETDAPTMMEEGLVPTY